MTIAEFDHLDTAQKRTLLLPCCGSATWANKIIAALPAEDLIDLLEIVEEQWYACTKQDWLEAFAHHPKMGDLSSQDLIEGNKAYEEKFGYTFIINPAGKSADELLASLKARLKNNAEEEVTIAMEEQLKITKQRLEKLFTT